MTTTLEFTEELYAALDEQGILAFHEKKQEYCIRIKIAEKVSMASVFSERHKFHYMENEIRDLLMNYYSFYYELMEETFVPYNRMNFHDIALGVATGMRLFHMYAPAFFQIRQLMDKAIRENQRPKPFNWNPGKLKFQEQYQFVYEVCKNEFGLMIYQYDGYNFPQEVMDILINEFQCVQKYPEKIRFEDWLTEGWEYKEGRK